MNPLEQHAGAAVTHALIVQLFNRMNQLEERLGHKIDGPRPDLTVGEAVEQFKHYLREKTRKPENYDYLLLRFLVCFGRDRQFPTITAAELEAFLEANWRGNTLAQRATQIRGLWTHNIKDQRRNNLPVFQNVCDLIGYQRIPPDPVEFIPPERFSITVKTCPDEDALIFLLPLSSGMRVNEVVGLRPQDIQEQRILNIQQAKSGLQGEYAVIPGPIADLLSQYIRQRYIRPDQPVFDMRRQNAGNIVYRLADRMGLSFSIHYLRKWCATFWENQVGDPVMTNVVLRHAPDSKNALRKRYVAPIQPEEVINRQDQHLTPLFEKGGLLWREPSERHSMESSDSASSSGPA